MKLEVLECEYSLCRMYNVALWVNIFQWGVKEKEEKFHKENMLLLLFRILKHYNSFVMEVLQFLQMN